MSIAKAKRSYFIIITIVLLGISCCIQAASISVSIQPQTINVGESAVLSLVFEGGTPDNNVQIPAINNLDIQFNGKSSRQIIVNNSMSSQYILSYSITATKEGEYTIPSITATVGGQRVSSSPIKLIVTKVANQEIEGFAKLRLIVSKNYVRVGEPFLVELRLLFLALNGGGQPQISADGFTIGKLVQTESHTIEDGKTWRMISFKSYATALRHGELTLGPGSIKVTIPARLQRNFFGDTVVASWRTVVLTTTSYKIKVEPLPSMNVPAEFNGVIGVYNLTVNVAPTNVAVGDPITVKITISGRGPIESITLPEQPQWSEFKVYPPTSKVEPGDEFGLSGSKIFEQVVVPKSTETRELPPFIFVYYDTEKQDYQVLRGPRVPLIVRPSTSGNLIFASNANTSATTMQTDIVHIKTRPGAISTRSAPLIARPWFLAVQSIPAALWFVSFMRRKRLDELAHNPKLRRQIEAEKTIRQEMQKLPKLAVEQKTDEFFAVVFRLLQEKLGERLDLPATSITEAVIEEKLIPAGASKGLIDILQRLFFECNQARYGGKKNVTQLNEFIPMVEQAIQMLSEFNAEK